MTSRQWRPQCPFTVRQAQRVAMTSQLLIVRQNGPTAFSLLDNENKTYQVFLGDTHRCTCKAFLKNKELCHHICWALLKKLQLSSNDPLSYQVGMLPHEISDCLQPRQGRRPKRLLMNKKVAPSLCLPLVKKRMIQSGDTCPVCLDEFTADKSQLVHCKHSCGNAVHVKCMFSIAKYQLETSLDLSSQLTCPLCRGDFGTMKNLREAKSTLARKDKEDSLKSCHEGYSCCSCDITPVIGLLYRCLTCTQVTFCSSCVSCYTSAVYHEPHGLAVKAKPEDRWKPIIRVPKLNTLERATLPPLLKAVPHLEVPKIVSCNPGENRANPLDTRNMGSLPKPWPTSRRNNGLRPLLSRPMRFAMVGPGKDKCNVPVGHIRRSETQLSECAQEAESGGSLGARQLQFRVHVQSATRGTSISDEPGTTKEAATTPLFPSGDSSRPLATETSKAVKKKTPKAIRGTSVDRKNTSVSERKSGFECTSSTLDGSANVPQESRRLPESVGGGEREYRTGRERRRHEEASTKYNLFGATRDVLPSWSWDPETASKNALFQKDDSKGHLPSVTGLCSRVQQNEPFSAKNSGTICKFKSSFID